MAAVFKSFGVFGPASALLLLAALLAAGARAGMVTTKECKERGGGWWGEAPVRQFPVDSDATTLIMSGCSLTSIPQHQLSGLPAVRVLWLGRNELRELPVFREYVCANLTALDLTSNQLTGIYNAMTFSTFTKLDHLHLNDNRIQFIDTSVFTALPHLRHLNLQRNMLRYIPDQLLASNSKLEYLHLEGNRITHLPPEFASGLKRAGAGLVEFHFHNNPWHCACLIELLADVRRAGVRDYHEVTYDGAAPVCVHIHIRPGATSTGPCATRACVTAVLLTVLRPSLAYSLR